MEIAFISSSERGGTDRVLAQVATKLEKQGFRLAGVVQTNFDRPGTHHCDMDVRVLPKGPIVRISQNLGAESHGCRLDPNALETAVASVETMFADGSPIDFLVLNKFGKHEAEGRGFRTLIGDALMRGIPVITGINALNREAFETFTDGLAQPLANDVNDIMDWCLARKALVTN
jgi:nucleoside-triphosphatase THEP1